MGRRYSHTRLMVYGGTIYGNNVVNQEMVSSMSQGQRHIVNTDMQLEDIREQYKNLEK